MCRPAPKERVLSSVSLAVSCGTILVGNIQQWGTQSVGTWALMPPDHHADYTNALAVILCHCHSDQVCCTQHKACPPLGSGTVLTTARNKNKHSEVRLPESVGGFTIAGKSTRNEPSAFCLLQKWGKWERPDYGPCSDKWGACVCVCVCLKFRSQRQVSSTVVCHLHFWDRVSQWPRPCQVDYWVPCCYFPITGIRDMYC